MIPAAQYSILSCASWWTDWMNSEEFGGTITVRVAAGTPLVEVGDGFALPRRFVADVDYAEHPHVRLEVRVGADGRAACRSLSVQAREPEGAVTSAMLRDLPVRVLVRSACRAAMARSTREDGAVGPLDLEGVRRFEALQRRPSVRRKPRERLSDVELEADVAAYRDAVARGDRAPTKAAAVERGYARSTMGGRLSEARRRGLLGPTRERIAGETLS
jgi:hypothetical protein